MKPQLWLSLFLSLVPFTATDASPAKNLVSQKRRTVLDYFRLLPIKYFETGNRQDLLKGEWPRVVDIKNDYLSIQGDGAQPSLEVAIFRYRGIDLVAVSSQYGPDFSMELWRLERGKMRLVSDEFGLPSRGETLHYKLPQFGTTVKIYNSRGILQSRLFWKDGRFVKAQ
ncbi:hypothetical protein EON80_10860 [bacterium]|nr:MAG: hypothetical protein EON80_10860 [bacterium]